MGTSVPKVLESVDEHGAKYPGFRPGGCPGLGNLMANTNSLAREVTFDNDLQLLNFFPVRELEALRGNVFVSLNSTPPPTSVFAVLVLCCTLLLSVSFSFLSPFFNSVNPLAEAAASASVNARIVTIGMHCC